MGIFSVDAFFQQQLPAEQIALWADSAQEGVSENAEVSVEVKILASSMLELLGNQARGYMELEASEELAHFTIPPRIPLEVFWQGVYNTHHWELGLPDPTFDESTLDTAANLARTALAETYIVYMTERAPDN